MGILKKIKAAFQKQSAQPINPNNQDVRIKVYDAYGREFLITKDEWGKNILPQKLSQVWDSPDELYAVIVSALEDGLENAVVDASARLLKIDREYERSYAVRAIVLMSIGRLDEAQALLEKYVDEFGATGVILTNLAKVYDKQGDHEKAEKTLWQSIEIDPNQDSGLGWLMVLQHEKGGEAGYLNALKRAAAIKGSWRPQLWLARNALEKQRLEEALRYYEHILSLATDQPDALMAISGDLGNKGYLEEMRKLIAPLYSPERHGLLPGLNLLQGYLQTRNYEAGEQLLKALFQLNRPDFGEHLMFYSDEFEKLRNEMVSPVEEEAVAAAGELTMVQFEMPIWLYGMRNPSWMLDERQRLTRIAFLGLANISLNDADAPRLQRENELGRLTRSIPFFLLEQFLFSTDSNPSALMPVMPGVGAAVITEPWPFETFANAIPEETRFVVAGAVEGDNAGYEISLEVWDVALKEKVHKIGKRTSPEEHGQAVLELKDKLMDYFVAARLMQKSREPAFSLPLSAELLNMYLITLGQSFTLSLLENEMTRRELLWGERNIMTDFLRLAAETEGAQAPKIMLLSAMAKNKNSGSELYKEFKATVLTLLDTEKEKTSPFYKLSPLGYKVYELEEAFTERKRELLETEDVRYRQWLESL
ncbi:MAG TPA: tetratricopeptide repeat protein [Pyrinomonadaceae bacterium]|jgi:tetratricopeptide (TPR) repeat protein